MNKKNAFTLIELLIVVLIIAILAAIAVPNFLEFQTRAKVSRAKSDMRSVVVAFNAYFVDFDDLPPDHNDPGSPFTGLRFSTENGMPPDLELVNNDPSIESFYLFGPFRYLTTPIAYISTVPKDPFSNIMPYAYDTYHIDGKTHYAMLAVAGPDRAAGHWLRYNNTTNQALPYDPTNGTTSSGDIWRAAVQQDAAIYRQHYPFVPE